ncbi:MAG: NAD(P)-dependent oxidoreductase [Cyclobacteriaceae bacterium]|nr:NAD(P)-dependent oxidoreductase [Cyclobacteriaceae bacterium]
MRRILITGANGLVGQKLVELLECEPDVEIVATGRGPARVSFEKARYLDIDLTNKDLVNFHVLNLQPSCIIHSAAMTQVDACENDNEACWIANVIATENLLEASVALDAFFQYISTDFVFDGTEGPYDEAAKPNPINFYGKSKHAAEQSVIRSGLRYAIVRTVLVYGVGKNLSRSNLVLWVKNNLENGRKIRVVDDQWRTPTLVEDLALGCKLIWRMEKEGIFHISGDEYLTPFLIAKQVAEDFNLDSSLIEPTNANEFVETGKRPLKTGFDISKAKRELGYAPHSLREGLAVVIKQLEVRE